MGSQEYFENLPHREPSLCRVTAKKSSLLKRARSEGADSSNYEKLGCTMGTRYSRQNMPARVSLVRLAPHHITRQISPTSCHRPQLPRFNRSFCGLNQTNMAGRLFRADLCYSDAYVQPDKKGLKQMLVARVLPGEIARPQGPTGSRRATEAAYKLYDSTTDDIVAPEELWRPSRPWRWRARCMLPTTMPIRMWRIF